MNQQFFIGQIHLISFETHTLKNWDNVKLCRHTQARGHAGMHRISV